MDWPREMTDRDDEEVTFLLTLRPSPTPARKMLPPMASSPSLRWDAPPSSRWEVALEPGRKPRTPTAPPPPIPQFDSWDVWQPQPWKQEPQPPVRRNRPPPRPPRRPPRASVRRYPSWDVFPTKPYEVTSMHVDLRVKERKREMCWYAVTHKKGVVSQQTLEICPLYRCII